jgi:hypothetical protein
MGVSALGNAAPMLSRVRERVAFHDRDPSVRVGQYPGGEQPGHPGAEDHRMVTDRPHLPPPASASFEVGPLGSGQAAAPPADPMPPHHR